MGVAPATGVVAIREYLLARGLCGRAAAGNAPPRTRCPNSLTICAPTSSAARPGLAAFPRPGPAEPVAEHLVREVLGVHIGVLGGRGELAAVRFEKPRHVGALEVLHYAGLGVAERQRQVDVRVGPGRGKEALDLPEGVAGGDDDRSFEHVLQLADISRPGIAHERGETRGGDRANTLLGAPARLLEEVRGE